jgi:C4-dicarboxylate-specific signal transduction histidine kinase
MLKISLAIRMGLLILFLLSPIYLIYDNYRKNEVTMDQHWDMDKLIVAAYQFSEEKYHTQLEFMEFAHNPDSDRLEDFRRHGRALEKDFDVFSNQFIRFGSAVDPTVRPLLREIKEYYSELLDSWERTLQASAEGHDRQVLRAMALESEKTLDRFELNEKIEQVIHLQTRDVMRHYEAHHAMGVRGVVFGEALLLGIALVLSAAAGLSMVRAQQLFRRLVHAEKLSTLGQMSAGVAHELNNPLMFVMGFNKRVRTALQKSGGGTPELIDYLGEIDEGLERMSGIINHLRVFSRKSEKNRVLFSINASIGRAFSFFSEQLRLRGIRVELDLCAEDPQVEGEPNRFEQAVINLISNARDALEASNGEREPVIRVSTVVEGKQVLIRFADNGPGIPKKIMNRLFEPFFTTKPPGAGTGLGLSIVDEIVGEHSGKVAAESHPNQGAIFTIRLPCRSQRSTVRQEAT